MDYKKSLVRNTEQPLQKSKILSVDLQKKLKNDSHLKVPPQTPLESEVFEKRTQSGLRKKQFDAPELYSSLKLDKKIDNVIKPKLKKSTVSDKKIAVDEKVGIKTYFKL